MHFSFPCCRVARVAGFAGFQFARSWAIRRVSCESRCVVFACVFFTVAVAVGKDPLREGHRPQPQESLREMVRIDWSAAPRMPQGMQDNNGGVLHGQLVMVGGFCHGTDDDWKPGMYPRGFLKKVWALPLGDERQGWQQLPDLPGLARQGICTVVVDDALYVWGGFSYTAPFAYRDGFKLSRSQGRWQWAPLPELPRRVAAGHMRAIGSKILLVGGMDYDAKKYYVMTDRNGELDRAGSRLYVFNTEQAEPGWQELKACPGTPRMMSGCAAVDGKLYVMGGYAVDRGGRAHCIVDCWRYDPAADRWERLRDLPVAVAGFGDGQIVYRDRYMLLVTGYPYETILNPDESVQPRYGTPSKVDRTGWKQHPKFRGVSYENHIWVYDTQSDLYGTATPLPYDDHGPAAHVIGDNVYMFPGETAGFFWEGEYFGHAPEFVLKGRLTLQP